METQLGPRLKAMREFYGWSQRELAKRAGVPNSAISVIEQGTVSPSIISLEKVLKGFPISLPDFFAIDINRQEVLQHSSQSTAAGGSPVSGLQEEVRANGGGIILRLYSLDAGDQPLNQVTRFRSVILMVQGEGRFSSLWFDQILQQGDGVTLLTPTPFRVDPMKGPVIWVQATVEL